MIKTSEELDALEKEIRQHAGAIMMGNKTPSLEKYEDEPLFKQMYEHVLYGDPRPVLE